MNRNSIVPLALLVLANGLIAKDMAVDSSAEKSRIKKRDLKIGWVSQGAVSKSKEGQELEKSVMGEHRTLALEIERLQKLFSDAATEFSTKSAAMSADAREKESERVAKLKRDYEEAAQRAERTMNRKMQEATQEALKSFALAAEEYAQKNGYDVLLSESGAVYVNKDIDTTDEVSAIMNTQYDIKLAKNKQVDKAAAPATKMADAKAPAKADTKVADAKGSEKTEAKKTAKA